MSSESTNDNNENPKKDIDQESQQKISEADIEREELLAETDAQTGVQAELSPEGEFKSVEEIKAALLEDIDYDNIDDPDKKHELFYTIQNILNNNIEVGPLKDKINEEKRLFLNRGNKDEGDGVNADSRMSLIPHLNSILDSLIEWKIRHGSPIEIYQEFYDINEELGFH